MLLIVVGRMDRRGGVDAIEELRHLAILFVLTSGVGLRYRRLGTDIGLRVADAETPQIERFDLPPSPRILVDEGTRRRHLQHRLCLLLLYLSGETALVGPQAEVVFALHPQGVPVEIHRLRPRLPLQAEDAILRPILHLKVVDEAA